jgi:hypothetical protein
MILADNDTPAGTRQHIDVLMALTNSKAKG